MREKKIISMILSLIIIVGGAKVDLTIWGNENKKMKEYVVISEEKNINNILNNNDIEYEVEEEAGVYIYSFEEEGEIARKINSMEGITVSEDIDVAACWKNKKSHSKIRRNTKEWNIQLINKKTNTKVKIK